jgi:hypothetical protein
MTSGVLFMHLAHVRVHKYGIHCKHVRGEGEENGEGRKVGKGEKAEKVMEK